MFPKFLEDIVRPFLEDLGTPRSLTVMLLIEHGEFDQLSNLEVDPAQYLDPDSFYRDRAATDLLRKLDALPTTVDRAQVAVQGFHDAEKRCYVTNEFLRPLLDYPLYPLQGHLEETLLVFTRRVKKRITRILGRLPTFLEGRHGPGATYLDKGSLATIPHKMVSRPTVTAAARDLLSPFWTDTYWYRSLASQLPDRSDPLTVPGNRFTTVPKDCTKDRGIAVEPSLNVFFQLGVGRHMRERLRRVGIDLDEGQSLHRQLAMEASISGAYSTIDLSSASDTVAFNLVKLLLPDDWFELLNSLRSPTTLVQGKRYRLQKFSSMGNGFTFELETLIFFAICEEVCESKFGRRDVFCYGDDIIVPSEASSEVLAILRVLGFTPNRKKTYTTGLFRESCGGDYFNGKDVRPYFLKQLPNTPDRLISLINGLNRYGPLAKRARLTAMKMLPSKIRRLKGPSDLGDLVIHDPNPKTWSTKVVDQIRWVRVWRPIHRSIPLTRFGSETQLACALYGIPSSGIIPRSSVKGYTLGWSAYS